MKNAIMMAVILSALGSTIAQAEQASAGYVGEDCYGTVICDDGHNITCQTEIYSSEADGGYSTRCTRQFHSADPLVLCQIFRADGSEVASQQQVIHCN